MNSRAKTRPSAQAHDLERLRRELEIVAALQGSVGSINPRPPGLLNNAIQLAKKSMRRSLTWYTRSLHEYQAAVSRALHEELQVIESLRVELEEMRRQPESVHQHLFRLENEVEEVRNLLRRLERLQHHESGETPRQEARGTAADRSDGPTGQRRLPTSLAAPPMEFDYFLFQERFRGDQTLIKTRQRAYAEYFEPGAPVLDLGCGRGEFLELMRERGIAARGVESSTDAFLICKEKGLQVSQGDLFEFLKVVPDASVGGIFCAQVIEHLPVELQLHLVHLAGQKLRSGAPLVIETINPECVFALVRNFYLDPTHVRPVHPEMLRFALETKGFRDVELKFSSPVEDKFLGTAIAHPETEIAGVHKALAEANHFLFGYQDYAAIARRN